MIRKFILPLLFILFFASNPVFSAEAGKTPDLKPLKIEHSQDYKYGNLEKNFKNPNFNDDFDSNRSFKKGNSVLDILNIIALMLFFVILFIWLAFRIRKAGAKFARHNKNFKIISSTVLDDNKKIYLVEIKAKQYLIGTNETGVTIIKQADKTDADIEIPDEYIEKIFNTDINHFKKLK